MDSQQRIVLFYVFVGFFVLIGLVSISVLLGFPKSADPRLRKWAIPGFLASVVGAVIGLFNTPSDAPLVVTLALPPGITAFLKDGKYEFTELTDPPTTQEGALRLARAEGGAWQAELPRSLSGVPTTLKLRDDRNRLWLAGPFYPNYTRQDMRLDDVASGGGQSAVAQPVGSPLPWSDWIVPVLAAAQQKATSKFVRLDNFARASGTRYDQRYYEWRVFVNEPASVLNTIARVEYVLHPTFPDPFRVSRDVARQFELVASGWGEFTILVTVYFKDGSNTKLGYDLKLGGKPWPAEAPRFHLGLATLTVKEDGGPGATGWTFDILVDGKVATSLAKQAYNDRQATDYLAGINRSLGTITQAMGKGTRVEVRGRRTSGSDTAVGSVMLDAKAIGTSVEVPVVNAQNAKKGSFVFRFELMPQPPIAAASARGA